ncbi:VOC family protein [Methanolobus sp. WCC4]|uniref:VOC family protein n=1 Tax=Methanolobus sp. WCC4 TaxID=3125784 RepID=UPI0030FBDF44
MGINNLFPVTITDKIGLCKDFYTEYFAFEVIFEAEWYIHLRNGSGIEIAFMLPDLENQPDFLNEPFSGKGIVLSFEVDDAKVEYDRLKGSGAPIVYHLKDEEWGQRHFMITDPAGMIIDIVQQL